MMYYRARDLEKEVIFDFSGDVKATSRENLEKYFEGCLDEKQAMSLKTPTDEISILFFKDTLSKICAGRSLTTVSYPKE